MRLQPPLLTTHRDLLSHPKESGGLLGVFGSFKNGFKWTYRFKRKLNFLHPYHQLKMYAAFFTKFIKILKHLKTGILFPFYGMSPSSMSCILGKNKYSNDEGKHTHTINGHSNDKKWSFAAGAASNLMGPLLGRCTEGRGSRNLLKMTLTNNSNTQNAPKKGLSKASTCDVQWWQSSNPATFKGTVLKPKGSSKRHTPCL